MSDKLINIGTADKSSSLEQEKHFSQGLRVLAIDDNVVCLKVLACELQKCGYQVTITTKASEAIEILRKSEGGYHIVITDVMRSDMDGFKLLEIIGLEMDIPVIMTSANSDMKIIEKGVKHGARDYLVKPVRIEILRNIWQHVIRKTTYNPGPAQKMEANRKCTRNIVLYKRNHIGKDGEATHSHNKGSLVYKKPRVTWTHELHSKFVAAVQQLGENAAVPTNILKLMNEPHLTLANVGSHLQKYREGLKQKEKMRQENKNCLDANKTRHLCDTSIHALQPNNQSFHAMNLYNNCVDYRTKSFGGQTTMVLPPPHPHPHHLLQQSNSVVLTPEPILRLDPHIWPDINAVKYQPVQCQRTTVNDYKLFPPQIPPSASVGTIVSSHPGFSATRGGGTSGQTNRRMDRIVPYPCASGALIDRAGTSNHMSVDATGLTTLFSQPDSIAGPLLPNSLPGNQTETEQINYTQFPLNNSEGEMNCHHMNESSLDDELRAIVSQFSEDAAPKL